MSGVAISAAVAIANLVVVIWAAKSYSIASGAILVAIAAAVVAGALVQRLRFGRRTDWTARFDPLVTVGFVSAFDAVLVAAVILQR